MRRIRPTPRFTVMKQSTAGFRWDLALVMPLLLLKLLSQQTSR